MNRKKTTGESKSKTKTSTAGKPSRSKLPKSAESKPLAKKTGTSAKRIIHEGDDAPPISRKETPKRKPIRTKPEKRSAKPKAARPPKDTLRLNKYIANSGICSRREADEIIKNGLIEVNGKQITEMGYQVSMGDKVTYAGERISPEKPVYILLNKPKDYITTTKDPEGRRTVLSLLRGIGDARIYPVGRLDRLTTGLLMLTNDGALAKKLTHPAHGVKKLYHVQLSKPLKAADMKAILNGVELEDGILRADAIAYVGDGKDKKQVGIEIHSGRNRIIRRLFEHLGYAVMALDRVTFAGLTKKDLPRGKWRHLTQLEVSTLKMLK